MFITIINCFQSRSNLHLIVSSPGETSPSLSNTVSQSIDCKIAMVSLRKSSLSSVATVSLLKSSSTSLCKIAKVSLLK